MVFKRELHSLGVLQAGVQKDKTPYDNLQCFR